jgi:hypothetical protein
LLNYENVCADAVQLASQAGLALFPATPAVTEHTTVAEWPGDDWRAFVELAVRVGSKILYAEASRVDQGMIDILTEAIELVSAAQRDESIEDEDAGAADAQTTPDFEALLGLATERLGQVGRVQLAFADAGIINQWTAAAEWFDEIDAGAFNAYLTREELARDALLAARSNPYESRLDLRERVREQLADLESKITAWADGLLRTPGFLGGVSRDMRALAAAELDPELGEWLNIPWDPQDPTLWAQRSAANDAVNRAEQRLPATKARLVSTAEDRQDELIARIAADPEFALLTRVDERKRFIKSFVTDEIGFASAQLTDRLTSLIRRREL